MGDSDSKEPMKSKKEWPSPKPTRKPTSWTKKVKETPEPTKSRKKKTKEPTKSTKSWSKKEYPSPKPTHEPSWRKKETPEPTWPSPQPTTTTTKWHTPSPSWPSMAPKGPSKKKTKEPTKSKSKKEYPSPPPSWTTEQPQKNWMKQNDYISAARSPYSRGEGIFSAAGIAEVLDVNDDGDDGVQVSSAKISGWNKKDKWSKDKWTTPQPSEKKTKEPTK